MSVYNKQMIGVSLCLCAEGYDSECRSYQQDIAAGQQGKVASTTLLSRCHHRAHGGLRGGGEGGADEILLNCLVVWASQTSTETAAVPPLKRPCASQAARNGGLVEHVHLLVSLRIGPEVHSACTHAPCGLSWRESAYSCVLMCVATDEHRTNRLIVDMRMLD